jgi:hypothetical protein
MRTVRFEELFSSQIRRLKVDFKKLDEAMEGLIEVLGNAPELFPQVPGTPLRMVALNEMPGIPPLSIFFLFDDETIYLMSAELIVDSE